MAMSYEQLKNQLSVIEPDEGIYEGITAEEVPLLKQMLLETEPWLAARAVFALSRVQSPDAINALVDASKDSRVEVRVAVAASAHLLPTTSAVTMLNQLVKDENIGVRSFAVQSISDSNIKELRPTLEALAAEETVPTIRSMAQEALTRFP